MITLKGVYTVAEFKQSSAERNALDEYIATSPDVHLYVRKVATRLLDVAKTRGVGTRGGATPAGGVPVDTGELQRSGKLRDTGQSVDVVFETDYAGDVHYGTDHGTYTIPPNPWLERSIDIVAREEGNG